MSAKVSITLDASASKVWEHLSEPELIKKYCGNRASRFPIGFNFNAHQQVGCLYWSSVFRIPGRPENYQTITLELHSEQDRTVLTVHENCTDETMQGCGSNWGMVLAGLKKQVER